MVDVVRDSSADQRTYIGAIDKAKQIHHSNSWNDIEVNLESQFRLGCLVELNKGLTIFICCEVAPFCCVAGIFPPHVFFVLRDDFLISDRRRASLVVCHVGYGTVC